MIATIIILCVLQLLCLATVLLSVVIEKITDKHLELAGAIFVGFSVINSILTIIHLL